MSKRTGLGRNLSALLSASTTAENNTNISKSTIDALNIHQLKPGRYQPRSEISDATLEALAVSIKKQGVLQPLIVRKIDDHYYEIIAGERRWRASQLAGLTTVPVLIRHVDDETAMAIALIENLQREDLNVMDHARAMHRLTDEFGLTHQAIADLLAISRTAVTNYLRLLQLAATVKQMLANGDLDMGHARCLLMLDEPTQIHIANIIVSKQLSVRDTERLVNQTKTTKTPPSITPAPFTLETQTLARLLQTKVQLKPTKSGKGAIVVHYNNTQHLEALIKQLQGHTTDLIPA